ncbi:hypothetical protein [Prauserella rugosa]|uniref:Type VII secretion system (Wss) protein ESAT-6 n=1 Tax=Prauserella rugosa TaxID=43354 RepID=A0A660CJZ6_9PSEU|nr:hypothetical protein [Prauserella rugosa]TWH21335.1 hypothetical protein JD82_03194 [Prauserella rugosa]
MGQTLNTLVNGSGASCRAAASFLEKVSKAAGSAADEAQKARTTGEADWWGPAHDAYQASTRSYGRSIDQLGTKAGKIAGALNDFADELDGVIRRMSSAQNKAKSGNLRTEGPFIFAPERPVAPNMTPTGPCDSKQARDVMSGNQQAAREHQAAVNDYNAKAAVYNECKSIVSDARTREGNAHDKLQQSLLEAEPKEIDYVSLGFTTTSHVRGFIGSMENTRAEHMNMANRFRSTGADFANFALGNLNRLPENFSKTLLTYASAMNVGAEQYESKAKDAGRFVDKIPQRTRDALAAYPGKGTLSDLPSDASKILQDSRSFIKGFAYSGALLTGVNEAVGAIKGEQSWGKALTDTGVVMAGSAAGSVGAGWVYGSLVGSAGGPVGAFVTGLAGGVLGGIGGQWVADMVNPE